MYTDDKITYNINAIPIISDKFCLAFHLLGLQSIMRLGN